MFSLANETLTLEQVKELCSIVPSILKLRNNSVFLKQIGKKKAIPLSISVYLNLFEKQLKLFNNSKSVKNVLVEGFLENIEKEEFWSKQIVFQKMMSERKEKKSSLFFILGHCPLEPTLKETLYSLFKINDLYTHQSDAIDAIRKGSHVVVSTSTARYFLFLS